MSLSSVIRTFVAVFAIAWITPSAPAQPILQTNAPQSIAELQAMIEAHVTAPRFNASVWGVKVMSLDSGAVLYKHHADRLMSPASNTKLFVGALALERLGPDYRIKTPIYCTRFPDKNGKLKGSLIICGRGDPSWRLGAGQTSFWDAFTPFVQALNNTGVRRVTGDLIVDATYFHGPPHGSSWAVEDVQAPRGAEISAITLMDNCAELRVSPGPFAGAPGLLQWITPSMPLKLVSHTTTAPKGGTVTLTTYRVPGEDTIGVFGIIPPGTNVTLRIPVPNPTAWFASALKEALAQRGIQIEGQVRTACWPQASLLPKDAAWLADVSSPPLSEMVKAFMKVSQNLEADLVFAHLGESTRGANSPEDQTSEQLAVVALDGYLRGEQLPAEEVLVDEGSGLSRNNLTTANAMLALLEHMSRQSTAEDFYNALPLAGVDGTLRRRMQGTAAEANARAKTGSLRSDIALSGYVTSAAGEKLAFSLLLNRHVSSADSPGYNELDAIVVMLANLAARSDDSGEPRTSAVQN
jgi:D-alanyl-D-alanine carboxypeptidase/D-alanyl-D-alanine-endopeptidase (penicillin-binding protein 4)